MEAEIRVLIENVIRLGHRANPYDLTLRLIDNQQSADLSLLVQLVLEQGAVAGTFFADAISFVPEQELPRLAGLAVDRLPLTSAEEFLAHCSLQQVQALHPFLSKIWDREPNQESYFHDWPWRESGLTQFDYLKQIVEQGSESSGRARENLLETRHPAILQFCAGRPDISTHDLLEVGFSAKLDQLYASETWHFVFPADFWSQPDPAPHLRKRHPTWTCQGMEKTAPFQFGGQGSHFCAVCAQPGHRLFSLENIPVNVPLPQLGTVRLETCLSCLGWEVPCLFYVHGEDGRISPCAYDAEVLVPQFSAPPLREVEVQLAHTPPRWRWQDWALANGRQNLHRVGGYPCWIQDADYLTCPHCQDTMSFLFQLDSFLPLMDGSEHLWGSGGICYGHWCARCHVSGYSWQCT